MSAKTERQWECEFDEYLDEVNEPIVISGMEFCPSRVLRELDPIAYREGLLAYVDSVDGEIEW